MLFFIQKVQKLTQQVLHQSANFKHMIPYLLIKAAGPASRHEIL